MGVSTYRLSENDGNYTGTNGTTANTWERIAKWQVNKTELVVIDPAATLKALVNDTTPTQISTGLIKIVKEDPLEEKSQLLFSGNLKDFSTWTNQIHRDYTQHWNNYAEIPPDYYISIYYKSATASVTANCNYSLEVTRITGLTSEEIKKNFPGAYFA